MIKCSNLAGKPSHERQPVEPVEEVTEPVVEEVVEPIIEKVIDFVEIEKVIDDEDDDPITANQHLFDDSYEPDDD